MPGVVEQARAEIRSKRPRDGGQSEMNAKRLKPSTDSSDAVKVLEEAIQSSQRNYNQIADLISIARTDDGESCTAASVALCRVFARLLSQDRLHKAAESASKNETMIADWLRQRYGDFQRILRQRIKQPDAARQELAVKLFMQLAKHEADFAKSQAVSPWRTGVFRIMLAEILVQNDSSAMPTFRDRFFIPYDDVRFFTYAAVADELGEHGEQRSEEDRDTTIRNAFLLLSAAPSLPSNGKFKSFISNHATNADQKQRPGFAKISSHQKNAQRAWIALLQCQINQGQRKHILRVLTKKILPFFTEPLRLMDFLTDSFNEGGSTALLAISGMFEMMTLCNLDYPQFYNKLYSLLDEDMLHSSNRSRFFRLLNEFLGSTHVPAAMIASFIKKLARLALSAPPAAIVVVVPLAYNLLNEHRSCSFMLHREMRTDEERGLVELEGAEDPFDPNEQDPMKTGAIDSCLWELVALQNHYHPNVASLATIISEQFTKPSYSLEDFLDYSYGSLLSTELDKEVKKAPIVEYQIPKRIFEIDDGDALLSSTMQCMVQKLDGL